MVSTRAHWSDCRVFRGPESGRADAADKINDPHAAPLRRDRPAAAVVAHRVGASPLHGRRRRPLAESAVAPAARLLARRDPRLPGPAWLLAVGGDSSPRCATAGTDRITAATVRAPRSV